MTLPHVLELGSRERGQPPPAAVVWDSLVNPSERPDRPWLDLLADEVEPRVLEAVRPHFVVWSSLWPSRPHERIRFDLRPAGGGCALRWTLTTTADPPTKSMLGHMRYRLNVLINGRLRQSYGQ
jgi:hypothetical protein